MTKLAPEWVRTNDPVIRSPARYRWTPAVPTPVKVLETSPMARGGRPEMKCFSCGKTGHGANRCPTLDVTFPFILPGWKAEKTQTGFLMISPRMATDRRLGGKRRLIRREGFASRISKNTRPRGGGIRLPNRQNCVKTKITKSPMDGVENPKPTLS